MNRNERISLIALTLAIAVCFGFASAAFTETPKDTASAALAFDKLKSLAGRWEATTDKGKVSATFQVALLRSRKPAAYAGYVLRSQHQRN